MNKKKISRVIASALAANMIASPIADNVRVVSATELSNVATDDLNEITDSSESEDSNSESVKRMEELSGVSIEQMAEDFVNSTSNAVESNDEVTNIADESIDNTVNEIVKTTNEEDVQKIRESLMSSMARQRLARAVNFATFSYTGENACKIVIDWSQIPEDCTVYYSVEGGFNSKPTVRGQDVILTEEELDLLIKQTGLSLSYYNDLFTKFEMMSIRLSIQEAPKLEANDLEDRLIGNTDNLEYRIKGEDLWHDYTDETKFTGDITVQVRYKGEGTKAFSPKVEFVFTKSSENAERTYVSNSEVHLADFCSEETVNSKSPATNFIDGNKDTLWHSNWAGKDKELFYTVRFDEVKYISSIEYLPVVGGNGNGRLRDGKVLVSYDGQDWVTAGTFTGLKNNAELQTINLDRVLPAKYVKIVATQTWGSQPNTFFSGRELYFYEDTSKAPLTEPMLIYSNQEETTKSVTVEVIYPEGATYSERSHRFSKNGDYTFKYTLNGEEKTVVASVKNIKDVSTDKGVYLSDLETYFLKMGYGDLMIDKAPNGGGINVIVDGTKMDFKKGLGIHATSTAIYEIDGYSDEYTKFTGYLGVNSNAGKDGSVTFSISTSTDGTQWTEGVTTDVLTGSTNAVPFSVDVQGVRFVKIYVDAGANNAVDHAVVADARLVKASYDASSEYYNGFKTLAQYDSEISSRSVEENYASYKKQVLEREFVSRYGYGNIVNLSRNLPGMSEALAWLQNDENALQLLIEAGNLYSGNGANALKALCSLYNECKEDLSTPMYKKMILATVAGYSKDIKPFMVNYGGGCLGANPVGSYKALKQIYDTPDGFVRKSEFETYSMELIRAVMDTRINYDEIAWLRAYIEKKYPLGSLKPNDEWVRYNGYGYASYVNIGYGSWDMYDPANKEKWDKKYDLSKYGVEYGLKNVYRAWMFMEKGAICWGLSGLGMVVNEVQGIPAIGTFQPGHEAYFLYSQNAEGKGVWNISDNIGGWAASYTRWGSTTQTEHRMLFGWGQKEYNKVDGGNNSSYILLGQDALNNYDEYLKSMFYNLIANSYASGSETHEEALNASLGEYSKNLDSMYNLYKSYKADSSTTDEKWEKLASRVATEYKYFPAPMVDLLKLIRAEMEDDSYKISLDIMQNNSLLAAKVATPAQSLQNGACQQVANSLLGNTSTELATFSFDGANANKIVINDKYSGSTIQVRVSFDGGDSWEIFEDGKGYTTKHVIELTEEQLAKISADKDILVGLMGRPENHTIDIKVGADVKSSEIYNNDLENRLIGKIENLEYSLDGVEWNDYTSDTKFVGNENIVVKVRYKAHSVYMTGNTNQFTFTPDIDTDKRKYVSINDYTLAGFCSQQDSGVAAAKNLIDGNINTAWHNSWGGDSYRYYTVKFDDVKYLSAVEWLPSGWNGRLRGGRVLTSYDGEHWEVAATFSDLPDNDTLRKIELPRSVATRYVKIEGTQTSGSTQNFFFTGKMLYLYEDTTKEYTGEPEIVYSTTEETNHFVTAKLVLAEGCEAEVTEHKFTENGSYDFEYTNAKGEKKKMTATVNNIVRDKSSTSLYLSDLIHEESSYAGWNGIRKDLAPSGSKIKVKYRDVVTSYDKGIGAHANSELIYDISMFSDVYNRFRTYVGVDNASQGGSVSFSIQLSKDGKTWEEKQKTEVLNKNTNAVYVDVDITGYSYIKLVADGGSDTGNDHAVYADAKLVRTEARIGYDKSQPGKVIAKLYLPAAYQVIGDDTHVFTKNGEFEFHYAGPLVGEKTITAVVDWLGDDDKDIANGEFDGDDSFLRPGPNGTQDKDENLDDSYLIEDTREFEVKFNYSTLTNQDVVATLVGLSDTDKVTSLCGDSWLFKTNGTHTFVVEDVNGRVFEIPVEVDWIDKEAPTATIGYDYSKAKEGIVIAKITKFSEDGVKITNTQNGVDYYEFTKEQLRNIKGEFTFEFVDEAGNTGSATANVNWFEFDKAESTVSYKNVDEDAPNTPGEDGEEGVVEDKDADYVIATIDIDTDKIEILNNGGSNEVKFVKNGVFAFKVRMIGTDEEFEILVKVDWLAETAQEDESPVELPEGSEDEDKDDDKDIADGEFDGDEGFDVDLPDLDPDFGVDMVEDPSTSEKDENIDEGFGIDKVEDPDTSDKGNNTTKPNNKPSIKPGIGSTINNVINSVIKPNISDDKYNMDKYIDSFNQFISSNLHGNSDNSSESKEDSSIVNSSTSDVSNLDKVDSVTDNSTNKEHNKTFVEKVVDIVGGVVSSVAIATLNLFQYIASWFSGLFKKF